MKKQPIFKGVGTAVITPFRDGRIDYPALERLLEWQISRGVDALIIGGTTGEAATLSDAERERLYSFCAEKIGGRVKYSPIEAHKSESYLAELSIAGYS